MKKTQISYISNTNILNSQKLFYSNLTKEFINNLIYIFDPKGGTSPIKGKIMAERKKELLDTNMKILTGITKNGVYINYIKNLPYQKK
jgi:hypothetical protein